MNTFKVLGYYRVINSVHRPVTKIAIALFFLDLAPNSNNETIYSIIINAKLRLNLRNYDTQ